jgi:RAMA domain-containing protein
MVKTLRDLIDSGALSPGTKLHHPFRNHVLAEAVVVKGGIEVQGRVYGSPSAAAKSLTGKAVQGWLFWKLPDGRPLNSLRSGDRV